MDILPVGRTKRRSVLIVFLFSICALLTLNDIGLNKASFSTLNDFDFADESEIPFVPEFQQPQHCLILSSRLYGKHTEQRRRSALDWYRHATLNSILLAAKYSELSAIMVVLKTRDSYEHEIVHDTDNLGGVVSFFQLRGAVVINDTTSEYANFPRVQEFVTKRQCQIISIMAIDADDILLPAAFQNIEMGWKHLMASNAYAEYAAMDRVFPHALLSGVPMIDAPIITLYPVSSDESEMMCSVTPPKKTARFLNRTIFVTASQGMTVTMPVEIWLSHFGGDDRIIMGRHAQLWDRVIPQMEAVNVNTKLEALGSKHHSAWLVTPLSSHYTAPRGLTSPCSLADLAGVLGEEVAKMLWENRQFIPKLSREEWESNALVKTERRVWLRKIEKWNAQSQW